MLPPPETLVSLLTSHDATSVMTKISRDRTATWEVLALLTAVPDGALVARLRERELSAQLLDSTAWLDDQWRPDALGDVRRLEHRASVTDGAVVLAELLASHATTDPRLVDLHAECAAIHTSCAEELVAWSEDRHDDAKRIRVAQLQHLGPASPIRDAARDVAASSTPGSPWGSLVGAYLLLETGR